MVRQSAGEEHIPERILAVDGRGTLPYFIRDNMDISVLAKRAEPMGYATVSKADLDYLSRQGVIGKTPEWEEWKQQVSQFLATNGKLAQRYLTQQRWSDKVAHSVFDYVKMYQDRIPQAKYLLEEIERLKGHDEIGRIKKINVLKNLCAAECRKDLVKWGAVDGLEFVRVEKNYSAMIAHTITTKGGVNVSIPDLKFDIVTYRDKWGRTFSYPIGVKEDELVFKAGEASKICRSLPAYLRGQVKSLYFFQRDCPMNSYWALEYSIPNFRAQATDGAKTTWWMAPIDAGHFYSVMCHESAHVFDYKLNISASIIWGEAIKKDVAAAKVAGFHYPTRYAEVSLVEDFAESVAKYIENPDIFRKTWKYRAEVIRNMIRDYPKG